MMTRAGTKSVADCHAVGNISSIDPVSIGPLAMVIYFLLIVNGIICN